MKLVSFTFTFKLLVTLTAQYRQIICINVNSVAPGIKLRPESSGREDHTVYPEYKLLVGGRAELACNVTLPSFDDAITLILWYRGDNRTPIYSVDCRDKPLAMAKHFASADVFATNRVMFDLTSRPDMAMLIINPVREEDSEEYRCRVDFRWGRTMSSFVSLNVIVPPRKLIISDEHGLPLHDRIGPYDEQSDLRLFCEAEGGKPPPALVWYSDNKVIDETHMNSVDNKTIYNDLLISNLSRNDLNSQYVCRAENPSFISSIFTSVTIDINLRPLDIRINSVSDRLSFGRSFEFTCESHGSRPSAQITWYRDNRPLNHMSVRTTVDGNNGNTGISNMTTTSLLTYIPSGDDNGAYLSCRAENLRLANSTIEAGLTLKVYYAPKVSLLMSTSTKASHIREGDEIFMKCQINSNPRVDVIHFLFNGTQLVTNSRGVFINNSSLVIKSARKDHKGVYQCVASNSEGNTQSNELLVDVRYAPICKSQKRVFGAAFGEKVRIACVVDALPNDVAFQWTVNNDESLASYVSLGMESTLTFVPKTRRDFGVVACRAKNTVGVQKDACLFTIVSIGLPSPVSGCLVVNQSSSSLHIDCVSGDDGGLHQTFHLELYESDTRKLMANISETNGPQFTLTDLSSGTEFLAVIYAVNSKGRSAGTELTVPTLALLNKKFVAEIPESEDISVLLAIFIGAVLALIAVIIIVAIVLKVRRTVRQQRITRNKRERTLNANATIYVRSKDVHNDNTLNADSSKNPDVIPALFSDDCDSSVCNGDIATITTSDDDSRYHHIRTLNSISSSNHISMQSLNQQSRSNCNEFDKQNGIFIGNDHNFSSIDLTATTLLANYIKTTQDESKAIQRQRVFPLSTPV